MANRRRGRPVGSGIDDTPVLEAIAALIESDPQLPVATAIKIADPQWTASSVRRLEKKWSRSGDMLVAKIRQARADSAAAARPALRRSDTLFAATASVADRFAQACAGFDGLTRVGRMFDDLPGLRAARERQERFARLASLTEPRHMSLTRTLGELPATRLARSFENSAMRRVMEQHERVIAKFGF